MADMQSFIADPVIADLAASPLAGHRERGTFGASPEGGPGVTLSERFGLAIAEATAWRGSETRIRLAIKSAAGLSLRTEPGAGVIKGETAAFNIGPGRYLVSGTKDGLVAALDAASGGDGTVTDLSHGRSAIRIDGPQSRWVLAKLFPVDFADEVFAKGNGVATAHHDILAQIQRVGADAFDVYVFRSFARSFWHLLCRSAGEVGYRVD
ncbi:MAG: sarcosine oxidase subunit gamma family protein [Oricola sp.]